MKSAYIIIPITDAEDEKVPAFKLRYLMPDVCGLMP